MRDPRVVRDNRFPISLVGIYFGILLLMSGIHTGIVLLFVQNHWNVIASILVPLVYWALVAVGITMFTRAKVKSTYEEPLHMLADATRQVANGDFSVYVPTIHTQDRLDYLDVMILDFNKMVEELGSIETLKTDFVSNVSHEMKTPIAVINNYAQLLQKEQLDDQQRIAYAETIDQSATKLANLIGNILKLNRLENQKITPEVEAYDVCRQLCDCILQYESKWDEKEIELDIDLEDYAMIKADESLLEIVWNNLLSNAIKFTEPGGNITIKQTSIEDEIKISISDSGCGMSEECVRHIFDKFYQGDTSRAKEGNGLGLALVYRVLQLLDGEIDIQSVEGEGSTFTVTLPAIS